MIGVVLTVLAAIDGALVALWYYTRIEVAIAVGVPTLAWAAAALRRRTRQVAMIGVYVQILLVLCLVPAIVAAWFGGIGYVPRAVAVWLGAEIALTVLG